MGPSSEVRLTAELFEEPRPLRTVPCRVPDRKVLQDPRLLDNPCHVCFLRHAENYVNSDVWLAAGSDSSVNRTSA